MMAADGCDSHVGVNAAYLDASLTATSVTVPATAIQLDASRAAPAAPPQCGTPAALAQPQPGSQRY